MMCLAFSRNVLQSPPLRCFPSPKRFRFLNAERFGTILVGCTPMKTASPEVWKSFMEFVSGFTAASELYGRATKTGSFVESVCLGASITDAMLRIGLVFQHQIDKRTRDIPLELVFQGPTDKPISERDVYRRAREQSVIDDAAFTDLQALYDDRNRVIHRYIISRITTAEVLDIAIRYEKMVHRLSERLHAIEERQIEEGVGITVRGQHLRGMRGEASCMSSLMRSTHLHSQRFYVAANHHCSRRLPALCIRCTFTKSARIKIIALQSNFRCAAIRSTVVHRNSARNRLREISQSVTLRSDSRL
jgi:hypothetical protein